MANMLKLFSTYDGHFAYRTIDGSFFIQELCRVIDQNVNTDTISQIIAKVTKTLSSSETTR